MSVLLSGDKRFAYEALPDGGARLVRCYGEESVWRLPERVDGHVIREAAAYLFSAGLSQEPFAPAETAGPVACGELVEEVYFPDTLRKIGRYAFYNCRELRVLGLPGTCLDLGGGTFNGCRRGVRELHVNDRSDAKSCLRELLSELNETLRVHYSLDGQFLGTLLFPEYYEEAVENTPARNLETRTHGVGHQYRYCFQNGRFSFRDYDAKKLFYYLQVQERPETVWELALWRLRYPHECREEARGWYEAYVREHLEAVTAWLLGAANGASGGGRRGDAGAADERGSELFRWFVRYPAWSREEFMTILEVTNRAGRPQEVSYIMEEKGRRFPAKRRSFDF